MELVRNFDIQKCCTAIVFCGGRATRMQQVLHGKSKALVKIHQKPYLYGLLNQLSKFGIKKVILCVSPFTKDIVDNFQSGCNLNLEIIHSFDSGYFENADALWKSLKLVNTSLILCINGDTIVDVDFTQLIKVHIQKGLVGTLVGSRRNDQPHPQAVEVDFDGKVIDIHEKAQDLREEIVFSKGAKRFSNSGIYVFDLIRLKKLWVQNEKKGKLEEGLLRTLAKNKELFSYDNKQRYLIDIGVPKRLEYVRRTYSQIARFFVS